MVSNALDEESRNERRGAEDLEMVDFIEKHAPRLAHAMDGRREISDSDDEEDDFLSPPRHNCREQRHNSVELGRDLTPTAPVIKGEFGGIIKPNTEQAAAEPLDPLARHQAQRQVIMANFEQMYRDLSPMVDGDRETVKARFEERASIRRQQKEMRRYFDEEDRMRKEGEAPPGRRRALTGTGKNLIDLTGIDDE